MKLNHIKRACMSVGEFIVLNNEVNDQQWIGHRKAMWPVEGVRLTEKSIPALFDLTEKKRAGVSVYTVASTDAYMDYNPQGDGETRLSDLGAVWHDEDLYRVVCDEEGVMFINVLNLKPAEGEDDYMRFCKRSSPNAKGMLIAVYNGLLASGMVMPEDAIRAEQIMGTLETITALPLARIVTDHAPDGDPQESGQTEMGGQQ